MPNEKKEKKGKKEKGSNRNHGLAYAYGRKVETQKKILKKMTKTAQLILNFVNSISYSLPHYFGNSAFTIQNYTISAC